MKPMRRAVVATVLASAATVGSVAFALPASAADSSAASAADRSAASAVAAYNGVCGAGYKVVDFSNIGTLGTAYLTWNATTGENCAVTVRARTGAAVYMHAKVFQTNNTQVSASDSGAYTSYAGPVYIPARFECVTWRGQIADQYVTGAGHCG
ncbi:spore-associated protein A [Streptomyces sp. N2A]|uniref:spore-associated protein A n=1 Tax=Streptomyces sp. N2A TaxID=3073936 RepID=UPI0028702C49|nr:spore-associated protein A [Streptomyces sp. N2A]